jgi:YaiO family outer membrane protein
MRHFRYTVAMSILAIAALPARGSAQDVAAAKVAAAPTVTAAADFSYVSFSGTTDPWQLASVAVGRRAAAGSLYLRANYANRFNTTGVQVEADAYPRLNDRMYLYLNAGYSDATVFPKWRAGGEVFTSLPHAWEASLGIRQLRFGGAPVTMFTGAVGKYVGNYWLSLRPFLRSKDGGLSASAGLTARRYFEDGDHWVGAAASYGSSPTDRVTPDAVGRSQAFSASLNGSSGVAPRLLATWTLGYDSEELSPGNTRNSTTLSAGLKFTF